MIDFNFRFETEADALPEVLMNVEEEAPALADSAPLETTDVAVGDVDATADGSVGKQAGSDGADIFHAGDLADTVDGLEHVTDFAHGQDMIDFSGLDALTDSDFAATTAEDLAAALASANEIMGGTGEHVVAVQVGADVIVFADTGDEGHAGSAVLLVGRSLTDVSASDFG